MAKNKLYKEMYDQYNDGFTMSEVGRMYGLKRQTVFGGFKRRKYELRKKKKLPFLVFNGKKFTLRNNGYYGMTDGVRQLMHRAVWEDKNGKIKEGMDIHHINHDKTDNRIENLEIYTKSDHAKKFNTGRNQYSK